MSSEERAKWELVEATLDNVRRFVGDDIFFPAILLYISRMEEEKARVQVNAERMINLPVFLC